MLRSASRAAQKKNRLKHQGGALEIAVAILQIATSGLSA
jgi:hypothetical protein